MNRKVALALVIFAFIATVGLTMQYPAPQENNDVVIIPHSVAENTMVSVKIGDKFIVCDTTPGGLNCQNIDISAIHVEAGEIHVLTYQNTGYICTVAGCERFGY